MQSHYFKLYLQGSFVSSHYRLWAKNHAAPTLCCVHGLTRNCRDFDALGQALSSDYRVASLDVLGRGDSAWLGDASLYQYETYLNQASHWLTHLASQQVAWVGTSMGGILGMLLAAAPDTPIRQLVISDVGPVIPLHALQAIGDYLGKAPNFASLAQAEQYLRAVHAGFGPLTDAQWQHLAQHSVRRHAQHWQLKYDPAIARAFADISEDVDLRPIWDRIQCPVLVLRGEQSQLLSETMAEQMAARDNVTLKCFAGVGHAPMMMDEQQIAYVRQFLDT